MEREDQVLHSGAAMTRVADLTSSADGSEPIVCCPGWTMRDLVVHLGTMHRWAAATVLSGVRTCPSPLRW